MPNTNDWVNYQLCAVHVFVVFGMGCFLCGHLDHLGQEKGSCVVFSIGLLKPNGHHDFTLMHTEPAIFKKNRFTAYKTKVTIGYSQRVMSYNLFRCLI